jgi:APA family basic amino acid/polyamine antiporter
VKPPHILRRDLGLLDAVGIGIGAIVGGGIFVVSGIGAEVAGPALLVALLLAGTAATANALSSAQLAATYPMAGGTYEYGYRVLSPTAGYTAGWMFLASKTAAAGTVALGLSAYLDAFLPRVPPRAVAVVAVLGFTVLNYFGVRRSSRLNLAIVAVSLGVLVMFVVLGAGAFEPLRLRPFAPAGWRGLLSGAAIMFFAYTGYARIATLGEEIHDPRRTIPRAIVLTLVTTGLLYVAVVLVALGAVGADGMAASGAPLLAAASSFDQEWAATIISVGAVVAMLGVMLSQILGLSRMAFAMARRGDLPRWLERVHPDYGTPNRAILLVGAVAALVAATGTLRGVATAAAFAILVYYGIANLAALRMPAKDKLYPNVVPWVGMVACAVLAVSLDLWTIAVGCAVLAVGLLVRWLRNL